MFDRMIDQHTFGNNMFAFYLSLNQLEDTSELTLGGYDPERIVDEIVWHPVLGQMYWSIQLDDILINGKPMGICKNSQPPMECRVTPDSGTTMMTMPSWAHK